MEVTFTPLDEPPEDLPEQTDLSQVTPPALRDEAVATRAMKYDVALKQKSPGRQWLEDTLRAGGDDELRCTTAIQENVETLNAKTGIIQDMAKAKGGSLTPE